MAGCLTTRSYNEVVPDFIAPMITKSGSPLRGDVIDRSLFSFNTWIARTHESQWGIFLAMSVKYTNARISALILFVLCVCKISD